MPLTLTPKSAGSLTAAGLAPGALTIAVRGRLSVTYPGAATYPGATLYPGVGAGSLAARAPGSLTLAPA